MINEKQILIFKSRINSESTAELIGKLLEGLNKVYRWSVDFEDPDRILRVVASTAVSEIQVLELIRSAGVECEVLPE